MTDLLQLAERCERASGPDRELDALIWCALNGKRYKGHFPVGFGDGEALGHTRVEFTEPPKRTRIVSGPARGGDALPYTASIDAAMTLVPEGTEFYAERFFDGKSQAAIWLDSTVEISSRECTTPALALCAAALRARHAEKADA